MGTITGWGSILEGLVSAVLTISMWEGMNWIGRTFEIRRKPKKKDIIEN